MGLINDIKQVDQDLALVYQEAKATWKAAHPAGPWPELNETFRETAVSQAYWAQGREPLPEINRLRGLAGLGLFPIGSREAKNKVTGVRAGKSAHNHKFALDVRFRLLAPTAGRAGVAVATVVEGVQYSLAGIDWGSTNNNKYYLSFVGYMVQAAKRLLAEGKIKYKVRAGHDWNGNGVADETFVDDPHYEILGWEALVAAGIKARLL